MQPSIGEYFAFPLFKCVLYFTYSYITNHLFCYNVNNDIVVFDFVFVDVVVVNNIIFSGTGCSILILMMVC